MNPILIPLPLRRGGTLLAALAGIGLLLCSCSEDKSAADTPPAASDPAPAAAQKPMVLASNYATAFLAYRIAGDDARVVFPVPAETAPDEWKPSAEELKAMRGARLILSDDTENPSWVRTLARTPIPVADIIDPLHGSNDHPDGLAGVDALTAAFLEPDAATTVTQRIANALGQLMPSHKSDFDSRAETITAELTELDARWNQIAPHTAGKHFLALGPALEPWAARAGLSVTMVKSTIEMERAHAAKPAVGILVTEPPSDYYRKEFARLGLKPLVLDPGLRKPAQGDFLAVLESNLAHFEPPRAPDLKSSIAHATGAGGFEHTVVPLIEKYCIECHDAETNEGELDFEVFLSEAAAEKNPDLWETVAALLEMDEMPPRKKKNQPTEEEHRQVIAWVRQLSERWDRGEMGRDPGRTTLRRLNKNEYNYTIRDLFGIRLRPADNFPEDGGGEAGFDNNADALFLPSLLMENYVEAAGNIVQAIYADRQLRARYLFKRPGSNLKENEAARDILAFWATRAYRRPIEDAERARLVAIYKRESSRKKNFDDAMKMPLVAILISPNFLYRAEKEKSGNKPYRLDGFDLANRLSYFLWSSMPDEELAGLAKKGRLHDPKIIEAQVLRMLNDEKARSLSMHFAGQWFGWELLRSRANPDEIRFPEFDFGLRVALYRESAAFFGHLIDTNASAFDLIDSDYAFLNDRLARHYGIPGVSGAELRKVALTDPNRGGVLGMGSVLTATSLPLRSSPAARGDYVLTEILGTPTPEPPMNVEQLPEDDREVETKTFREALVQHREDPNCKACHEVIDPIGFGLESFDAIGRWRTTQNGNPLDTAGVMPDGTRFSTPAELKKQLSQKKDLFARNMAAKLLSYALGRDLTPYDRPSISTIAAKILAEDGRIHTAFIEVAKSYPFQYRRSSQFTPEVVHR